MEDADLRHTRKMVRTGIFAGLMAVCAWIALPLPPVGFTLQTLGVLLALGLLGGKWGTVSILLYLTLGFAGLPVFSGFRGGLAALLDPRGGFLLGFLVAGLVYWLAEGLGRLPAMAAALAVTYLCGCWWFSLYAQSWTAAVLTCVVPYLVPDGIKLWLALHLTKRLKKYI